MINVYSDFAQNFMAMPVVKGLKSKNERFAGAEETYCIEALMQDGKALKQDLSFFRTKGHLKHLMLNILIKKVNKNMFGQLHGVSTRLMGALIMTHSDDHGLVLPPKLTISSCYNSNLQK